MRHISVAQSPSPLHGSSSLLVPGWGLPPPALLLLALLLTLLLAAPPAPGPAPPAPVVFELLLGPAAPLPLELGPAGGAASGRSSQGPHSLKPSPLGKQRLCAPAPPGQRQNSFSSGTHSLPASTSLALAHPCAALAVAHAEKKATINQFRFSERRTGSQVSTKKRPAEGRTGG